MQCSLRVLTSFVAVLSVDVDKSPMPQWRHSRRRGSSGYKSDHGGSSEITAVLIDAGRSPWHPQLLLY